MVPLSSRTRRGTWGDAVSLEALPKFGREADSVDSGETVGITIRPALVKRKEGGAVRVLSGPYSRCMVLEGAPGSL